MSNPIHDKEDTISPEHAKLKDLNSINAYISNLNQDFRKTSIMRDKDLERIKGAKHN